MTRGKICNCLISCLICIGFAGCVSDDMKIIRSGASIIEKGSGWKIRHPRDNTTAEKLNILENDNLMVQIRFSRHDKYFYIATYFRKVCNPIEFKPSCITLKLSNGEILNGKPLSCYNEKWDLESLISYPPVDEPIIIHKRKRHNLKDRPSYAIFFNRPPPSVEETFTLFMNDALTSQGAVLHVPPIYFQKTVNYKIRFGLVQ